MTKAAKGVLISLFCAVTIGSTDARSSRYTNAYDGSWHLTFATQAGQCDTAYDFDVNILSGVITHPNLVKFRGSVTPSGAVRASVTVHDKFASGSGRLSSSSGRGFWRGHTGSAICSGYWTARKN